MAETVGVPTVTAAAPKKKRAQLDSAQKAAAVIVALGANKASQIYKYMEPEDVEHLTIEVAKLGHIDAENRAEQVL